MISSAVVIPEQSPPVEEELPSPSLKRRQSLQSVETNKRPRVHSTNGSINHGSSPPPSAMSPPRRKSSLFTGAEEKKRGQRLFGGLLGTLSQTSIKPNHRKRDEIEKRQQDRLRRDVEEHEEETKRKKEELDRTHRAEQKIWDRQSSELRHRNMRAMAGFLRTSTEPRLYYKPWELRPEEEEQIKKQKDEVVELIRRDQDQGDGQSPTPGKDAEANQQVKEEPSAEIGDAVMQNGTDSNEEQVKKEPGPEHGGGEASPSRVTGESSEDPVSQADGSLKPPTEDKPKEDDHGGEELVEGHEDQVIY